MTDRKQPSNRRRAADALLRVVIALASTACSASNLDVSECSSDEACVEAFGAGYTCSPSGTCAAEFDSSGDESGGLEPTQLADACGSADIPVFEPSDDFRSIDTEILRNDFDELNCLATRPGGNDGFFALDLAAGDRWHFHVRVTDEVANPAVYVLRSCDERACQPGDGNDLCGDGTDEHVSFVAPESGRYYVGIDTRAPGGSNLELLAVSPTCGNGGEPEHSETCDDGNLAAFDGCDPQCRAELTNLAPNEVEPNDDQVGANVLLLDQDTGSINAIGSIGGRCDFDNFFLQVPTDGASILAQLSTAGGQACPDDAPPVTLQLLASDARTLVGERTGDCPSIDDESSFAQDLAAGGYYLRVVADEDAPLFEYALDVQLIEP